MHYVSQRGGLLANELLHRPVGSGGVRFCSGISFDCEVHIERKKNTNKMFLLFKSNGVTA